MSTIAADGLVSLGYTNIWNLDSDFNSRVAAGLPVDGRIGVVFTSLDNHC